jgi:flagellar motor switch protein FliN
MKTNNPKILAETCKNATTSLATALQGIFERRLNVEGQTELPESDGWPENPSLMIIVGGEKDGFVLTISSSEGFSPTWVKTPDQQGRRKLNEFGAQCASILAIGGTPRSLLGIAYVQSVRKHMEEIEDVDEILRYQYTLSEGELKTSMSVYWPIAKAETFVDSTFIRPNDRGDIERLPAYGRSLLKVRVPLRVVLASSRLPVEKVMEIGPGSIIQFEKRFDQPLLMEIQRRPIALGNAVKVGDKFGFRVAAICKPRERFFAVQGHVVPSTDNNNSSALVAQSVEGTEKTENEPAHS